MRLLLALVLLAGVPAAKHDANDTRLARSTLLTAADFGKGWHGVRSPQLGVRLACPGHAASGAGIVETGAASSPSLSPGPTGPFVVQRTSVYRTSAQAAAYWRRGVTKSLVVCVAQTLGAVAAKGVKVKIDAGGTLALRTSLPHTAAYRVVATLNKLKTYLDVILIADGRTITEVTISAAQQAPPAAFEQGLARVLVERLGGPAA